MLLWTNLDEFVTIQHFISGAITGYLHILIVSYRLTQVGLNEETVEDDAKKFSWNSLS